ncbi:MAG: nitroreductase family protein [Oribacterium sp.]|nr:nitroreductase family protein [Oribacterium sp.]
MNEIFKRVSIRKYEDRPVEQEKIEKVLRAAMAAPSAVNQQPWEFYVVTDKEKIKALSECSLYAKCAAGAPVVLIPCFRTENVPVAPLAHIDVALAAENALLEITSLGLGGVWLAAYPEEERLETIVKTLDIPENLVPLTMIPFGYPAESREQPDRFDESRVHYVK